jgi:hypothetical protein
MPDVMPTRYYDIIKATHQEFVENAEEEKTSISVAKRWMQYGEERSVAAGSVGVELWQRATIRNEVGESASSSDKEVTVQFIGSGSKVIDEIKGTYPVGTVLTIQWYNAFITWEYDSYIEIDGEQIKPKQETVGTYDGYSIFKDIITVGEDDPDSVTIKAMVNYNAGDIGDCKVIPNYDNVQKTDDTTSQYPKIEDCVRGTYYLSGESWKETISDLPVTGYVTIDGKDYCVDYTYYVKEVSNDVEGNYTATYSVNGCDVGENFAQSPISSGVITITNTKAVGEGTTLPNTGGRGTIVYTIAGWLTILLAACCLYIKFTGQGGVDE